MQILELKKQITSGIFQNCYLFTGEEQYLIRSYVAMIEEGILNPATKTLNYEVLDECSDIDRILNACVSLPMFSDKKLVVVKESGLFQKKKEELEPLIAYVKNPCKSTCLIFWESKIDKRNALYKAVSDNGIFFDFEYRSQDELLKWIQSMLKKHSKTIEKEAALRLTLNAENGLYELENELNKLILYGGDNPVITLKDVEEVCATSIKAGIFELTDALAAGQTDMAYRKLYGLIRLKEPHFMIFFMIARQFMVLNDILFMKKNGLSVRDISAKMKTPDFITRKNMTNAERYGQAGLKEAIGLLNRIDMDIKSGRMSIEAGLDILIPALAEKKFNIEAV
ncbi:MAG: DNA polymerase III subunit delta [Clostridia bacterium]|jgi:DNA polymerase-3 subunit delta